MAEEELERTEIEALLETRRELGLRYDAELVDGFADRIQRAVEARHSQDEGDIAWERRSQESAGQRQLALGIVSVVVGIPTSAITLAVPEGSASGFGPLCVAWAGIVAVNFAHAFQGRRRRR